MNTYQIKKYAWKTILAGLGTSTNEEAKEYFSEMDRNRIPFWYQGSEDDANINLAFSKKKIEERKEWLTNWMEEKKRRRQLGLPDVSTSTLSVIPYILCLFYSSFEGYQPFTAHFILKKKTSGIIYSL